MKIWYNKEITNTLTVSCIIRATVRRKIWSKILGKTSVKKLVNKCGCVVDTERCSTGSQCIFLRAGSYTGVSTSVRYSCTALDIL